MSKKKVCKSCKHFYEGSECTACKSKDVATSFQGRIAILDIEKSAISKKIGYKVKGEYALKVR
ncbi:MAG: transcription elongation factor subunit Spt4 [Candidatus Woesearchaeota archaeon]|jgi:RNA polymerase subunit RPABC4/transcription elongation factor Spt4|nr:transcription elongation factor subunit Spt4 [Candidatus Woesearchaeota archaeon]|tara:strand:+ start:299 stop:487 length:189 start_codon:yes stop_codon:yes gene_type:complete